MYKTISIVFGIVHSNRTVVVLEGGWGVRERERTLATDFALSSILSALL
jgi:hypothetical protein